MHLDVMSPYDPGKFKDNLEKSGAFVFKYLPKP